MKNSRIKTLIFSTCFIMGTAAYADCSVYGHNEGNFYHGYTTCTSVTKDNLNVDGRFSANDLTITQNLSVNGQATGVNVHVNGNMEIDGATNFTNLTVDGTTSIHGSASLNASTLKEAKIYGYLSSTDTHIGNLTFAGNSIYASNTQFQSITVLPNQSAKPQQLCLKNSAVSGSITFQTAGGTVYAVNSKVAGDVVGGKLVQGGC